MKTQSLILSVFVFALFCLGLASTLDPDLGWHLKTGKWIAQNGIPFADPFSYTVPGKSWVAHEWLSELTMFWVERHFDEMGLLLFFAGLCVATFLLMYFNSPTSPTVVGLLLAEWGAVILRIVWGVRPQVFTILMTALFLFVIERVRKKVWKSWTLYGLCLLFILWQNLHSGFLLGFVLLAVYWAGDGWDARFSHYGEGAVTLDKKSRQRLLFVLFGGLLLSFFNPNGYSLLTYPFETLMSSAQQNFINEWLSPNFHEPRMFPFLGFVLFSATSFFLSKRKPQTSEVFLFLGSLGAALISARHIPFFVLVSIPIVTQNIESAFFINKINSGHFENRLQRFFNLILFTLFFLAVGLWTFSVVQKNGQEFEKQYPVAALQFLEKNQKADLQSDRLFHISHWGGFLIQRGIPVFIDGRPDLYGDDFCMQYLKALWFEKDWKKWSAAFQFNYTLFPVNHSFNRFLRLQPEWELIYQDKTAEIFKKRNP